jgi:methionyl-tRNA formyltransferase
MKLEDIGMLAIANNRSRYYLERLAENGVLPSFVILLESDAITPGQKSGDLGGTFRAMLKGHGIECRTVPTADVNSAPVIEAVAGLDQKYLIYSGPGGAILGKELLGTGKKFIHVHPGWLPDFRGSTTVYYHILDGERCGATALLLDAGIDSGPILLKKAFDLPSGEGCDLDYDYDPSIRSRVLVALLESYRDTGRFETEHQDPRAGETYFIMHPVLRHIARLKLDR